MPLYTPALTTVTSANITDDTIVNADVNSAAAIAYSKLNLASSIVNADINAAAAIAHTKLAISDSTSGRTPLLAPFNPSQVSAVSAPGNSWIAGARVTAGQSGTLHDLSVYIGTSSGNLHVGVYDTNEALAGSRSLLWDSGSVASPGTGWRVIGDPSLAVTAGKQYDLVVYPDNGTVTFGRLASVVGVAVNTMPTSFIATTGGATPKLAWVFSVGSYGALPATITEAQCDATNTTATFCITGRIT